MDEAIAPGFPLSAPVEHLLVGTHFTACSDYATERALERGNRLGAQVTVLHVVEDCLPRKTAKRRQHEARELLAGRVRLLCPDGGRDISINVRIGDPPLEIIREAIELGTDAIVLGMDGKGPFNDASATSTVAAVVRYSNTPLLLVARRPTGPYRRCAVDVSVTSQSTMIAASRFAPSAEPCFVLAPSRLPVALDCLNECAAPAEFELLFKFADGRDPGTGSMPGAVCLVETGGDPVDPLLNCVAQMDADLLIVGSDSVLQDPCEHYKDLLQRFSAARRCDLLLVASR